MRWPVLLFGWVIGTAALFLALVIQGADAGPQLASHPEFGSLLVGGDGAARQAPVFGLGAALALVQVGFLGCAFGLGVGARVPRGELAFAVAVHAIAVVGLLCAAHDFVRSASPSLLGPFPVPTTILVFGLFPAPLVYLVLFLRHFERWLPSAETESRLEAMTPDDTGHGDA